MSAAEAQKPDPERAIVGSVIARKFRLVRLLGVGGMGSVYEAEDLLLGRRVALKVMKPEIVSNDGLVQRFVREARAADSIQHKNIVRVLDLASDDESGQFYIVQELLSGESLADRLERERSLSTRDAVEIMGPVLDALAAAHERGIVHRDVKPENVFLHRDGGAIVPKLIDFGISKMSEGGAGLAKTQTGTALGTPYYMSPEQVRGDSSIDHRADQWSAGVMLFELLTGRRPFLGENYNLLILKIMTDRAPRADEVSVSVPTAVATVIARALEPDRTQRFASTRALRDALDRAIAETPEERLAAVAHDPAQLARRSDAPTLDAEAEKRPSTPASIDARAVAPTLMASPEGASEASESAVVARESVVESPAKKQSIPTTKTPTRPALALGAALAGIVSVAAVVGAARDRSASNTTSSTSSTGSTSQGGTENRAHAVRPSEPSSLVRMVTADAGLTVVLNSNTATVSAPVAGGARVRVRPPNGRVPAATGASAGAGQTQTTPGLRPNANFNTAPPASDPTPTRTPTPTPTPTPTGFVPVSTYGQ